MNSDRITREEIRELFINIKPYFRDRLGKYTHQRISGNWHFHGLGFVNGDMTYVFGVNLGFFKVGKETNYSHAGMNVLVRTNGLNKNLRKQYRDFFRENLSDWIHGDEKLYNSDRGGIGSEFPRYKKISNFQNQNELLNFFKESIDGIHNIYPKIASNNKNLFNNVLRAAPPWEESLVYLANEKYFNK